jgi:general stress protein CsbA
MLTLLFYILSSNHYFGLILFCLLVFSVCAHLETKLMALLKKDKYEDIINNNIQ